MKFVCDAVDVEIGGTAILKNISFVAGEQRIGIIGDNGSGKSTLARLLNGLVVATRGKVTVAGLDPAREGALIRRKVGFVFQNADSQIVMPTVAEDVTFGLAVRKMPAAEAARRTSAALKRFGLAALAERPCHVLSGGEKQLLALAGVMVLEPEAIVFDEPTTMLDRRRATQMMDVIRTLECQTIVVTHHIEILDDFDRVIVLEEGRVVADSKPDTAIARYLAGPAS